MSARKSVSRRTFLGAAAVGAAGVGAVAVGVQRTRHSDPPAATDARPHYDAIVIGSGYGGGVTALRLGQAGKSTLILEKGGCGMPPMRTANGSPGCCHPTPAPVGSPKHRPVW